MAQRSADGSTSFWGSWTDQSLDRDCLEGPLHVVLSLRRGRIRTVELFAGPDLQGGRGVGLGTVDGQEAVDFLLDHIGEPDDDGLHAAFRAVTLADGVRVAERLMAIAADRDLDDTVRERAIRAVVRPAEEEGAAGVADLLTGIATDRDDAPALRERAIRVLGEVRAGDAELRALYADLDRRELRERAIRVVAETRSDANTRWLASVATDATEVRDLRDRSIRVLAEDPGNADVVRGLYARLSDTELKERVVRVVGEEGGSAAQSWLRALALNRTEPTPLRERAIRVLGELGARDDLVSAYARVDDPSLKERIVRVVAEDGTQADRVWLAEIARDGQEGTDVRERAIRLLAESAATSTEIGALYGDVGNRDLKERVLRLLGERDDDQAVDAIIDIADHETDRDLRDRAFRILGESSNDRARAYLIERLRGPGA